MQTRTLGSTRLELPAVTFGAWAIGGWYWGGSDDDEALAALRAGFEAGVLAVDTAPVYGFGHSEELVGKAIAGRGDVAVLTKVGLRWDDPRGEHFFDTVDRAGQRLAVNRNLRPDSVRTEVERSLRRLGVERIDLVQAHWPDPTTPVAETMGALAELRAAGAVRAIGVSNFPPPLLEEAQAALGDVPLASDQARYSLVAREVECDVLPWTRSHGVGFLAYSPLEQGLLTGRVGPERRLAPDDGRSKRPTFRPENRRRVNELLARAVAPVADAHGATLAQTVLAWTAAQPGVTAVLAGARTAPQARENAAAGELRLGAEERDAIGLAFEGLELEPASGRLPGGLVSTLARWLRARRTRG